MHKRIKELASVANIDIRHIEKYADEEFTNNLDRFVELIVDECIMVMKSHDYHGEWLGGKLKEYFGVE